MEVLNHTGLDYLIHKISDSYNKLGSDIGKGLGQRIENTINITYAELVSLRDNARLKPGQQYRITDYETTTGQEDTRSVLHRFDIIVTAIDEKTLSEEALAAPPIVIETINVTKDENNNTIPYRNIGSIYPSSNIIRLERYIYEPNFPENLYINIFDVKIGCQVWTDVSLSLQFGTISNGADLYFTDNKLNAWKIWYCLDNDINRFTWAGATKPDINTYKLTIDGVTEDVALRKGPNTYRQWYYFDHSNGTVFTTNPMPDNNTTFYDEVEGSNEINVELTYDSILIGKGVIYRMIDEFENDCPYDFKNIQFKRKLTNGVLDTENGVDKWCYTFNAYNEDSSEIQDASVIAHRESISDDTNRCYGNIIKEYYNDDNNDYLKLNDIVFLNIYSIEIETYFHCTYNSFRIGCYSNSFGSDCSSNLFGNYCYSNFFGNSCISNSFGDKCNNNSFRDYCISNSFGNNCYINSFGNDCNSNSFRNDSGSNSFGNECSRNSFGNECNTNSFGNECSSNSFGNNCSNNSFVNECNNNSFGNSCSSNSFGDRSSNNSFGNNCLRNSFGNECNDNYFGEFCYDNSFGIGCYRNSFENNFYSNVFGDGIYNNSFGNECYDNSIGSNFSSNFIGNNCHHNSFGSYCFRNFLKNECYSNSFGYQCDDNSFGNECYDNSFGNYFNGNSFGNYCCGNSFGNYCSSNSFGNGCDVNFFGNYCDFNSFGNSCSSNSFRLGDSKTSVLKSYVQYNYFDDGCSYNVIWNGGTTSSNVLLKNINVNRGVVGTSNSYNFINVKSLNSEKEININNYNEYIYIDCDDIFNVTYNEIVDLRDNSQLIPGRQYRITDYDTTTIQENTQSARHLFDIIVTADDESTLNEVARAIQHDGDTYFSNSDLNAWKIWYCLDNDTNRFAWISAVELNIYDSSECTINSELINGNSFITPFNFESCVYVDGDGDGNINYDGSSNHDIHELIYEWGYFTDENDNTQLCLYKSDAGLYEEEGQPDYGDKYLYRGVVNVDGTDYDYWQKWDENSGSINDIGDSGDYVYATTARIVSNPDAYTGIQVKPKGVIYRMIDEFNNDCPYDFKNIQFKRCKVTSDLAGADLTTLAQEYVGYSLSGYGASMPFHISLVDTSDYKYVYTFSCVNNGSIIDASLGASGIDCYDNSIKLYIADSNVQYLNDIVMYAHPESGNHCITKNTFASDCFSMTLGCEQVGEVWDNHFGQYCKNNILVGPYIWQNDFGSNLSACYFSQQISMNNIGLYMQRNFVNNTFMQNDLGPDCKDNIFMKNCDSNRIGEQFMNNTCNDEFYQNNLGSGCTKNTFNAKFNSNVSYNSFIGNTINGRCSCCEFGTQCTRNTFGIFRNSKVESLFMSNVMCDTLACVFGIGFNCNNVTATKLQYSTFGTYIMYNNWTSSGDVYNIKVSNNLQGTTSNYNNIEIPADSLCEVKVSKNSAGEIKIYCEADLIA